MDLGTLLRVGKNVENGTSSCSSERFGLNTDTWHIDVLNATEEAWKWMERKCWRNKNVAHDT